MNDLTELAMLGANGAFVGDGQPQAPVPDEIIRYSFSITGRSWSVAASSFDAFQRGVADQTGVRKEHQILLMGPPFVRMDPKKPLSAVRGKSVFLYDMGKLSAPLALEPLPEDEDEEPSTPTPITVPTSPPPLSAPKSGGNPLLGAVLEYSHVMNFHAVQGAAYVEGMRAQAALVDFAVGELDTQAACLQAAHSNLEDHLRACSSSFQSFLKTASNSRRQCQLVLDSCGDDLAKLGSVALHPVLASHSRATLLDCVPQRELADWATKCQAFQAAIGDRLQATQQSFDALQASLGPELAAAVPSSTAEALTTAHGLLTRAGSLLQRAVARAELLALDASTCAQQVQDISVPTATFQSTSILEACRQFDLTLSRHRDVELPAAKADADAMEGVVRDVVVAKRAHTRVVVGRLRTVSSLQSTIRDFNTRVSALRSQLAAHAAAVEELSHVRNMPLAYEAALSEVARRRTFGRQYVAKVEEVAESLARMRGNEVRYRERFLRRHGSNLPKDLFPGLNERPPHAEILTQALDVALPAIDLPVAPKRAPLREEDDTVDALASPEGETADTGANSDEFSRERMLAMEHENATLRAELASMASLRFAVSQHITPVPAVALLAAPGGVALAGAGAGNEAPPPCGGDGDGPEALQTAIADAIARLNRLSLAASESAQAGAASGSLSPTLGTLQHCVHRVSGEFTSLLSTVSRLESEVAGLQSLRDRISFREFSAGDVALFFPMMPSPTAPAPQRRLYVAFNERAPHHFLSEESTSAFRASGGVYPSFIIGRIVEVATEVATQASNPYQLALGTTFHVLTVSAVEWGSPLPK